MPRQKQAKLRGQTAKTQSTPGLSAVIKETSRLWRKHHLSYDQTKYIVEQVRHQLHVEAPTRRRRTVQRLDRGEVERLVNSAYQDRSQEGLLIKTLFLTGARVSDFVHISVEDLFLDTIRPRFTSLMARAAPIAMCPYCRRLLRNCGPISRTADAAGFSRAIGITGLRSGVCRRWSGGVRSERASANGCTRTCCATQSPRSCSTPVRCRSIRFKNSSATSTCQRHRFTPKPACGRSVRTTCGHGLARRQDDQSHCHSSSPVAY